MKPSLIIALFVLLLSVSSCLSTRTTATWEKENIQPTQYKKMLVYCDAPTFASRSVIERRLAKDFTSAGLPSVTASDKLPNLTSDSIKNTSALVASSSQIEADIVLHAIVGQTTETMVSNTSTGLLDNKVSTTNYRQSSVKIENRLIDGKTGVLIMSVDTETNARTDLTDIEDIAASLSRELRPQLSKVAIANLSN